MATRIGLNGFGRIGRYLTRLLAGDSDIELAVVNARADTGTYAHLLKYDSVYGRFKGEIGSDEGHIIVDGKKVKLTRWAKPADTRWGDEGVDLVVEATGKFKKREELQQHIDSGARKVILSQPGKQMDLTLVYNVNNGALDHARHRIISTASCTTNCLAPVVKVLHERFGIRRGLMTTIHSYTMSQRLLDGSHKDLRRGRAAAMSQVPTTTGAARAVTQALPELEGRLDGMAVRVPTPVGSLIDLVCELEREASAEAVNAAFRESASETLGYTEEELVSADYVGDDHGGVVDGRLTMVIGSMAKVLAWYDNEAGFTHQLLRTVRLVASGMGR